MKTNLHIHLTPPITNNKMNNITHSEHPPAKYPHYTHSPYTIPAVHPGGYNDNAV